MKRAKRRKEKRIVRVIIIFMFAVCVLCISVSAKEGEAYLPDEYYSMLDELPREVADALPDGVYSDDASEVASSIENMVSPKYFFGMLTELVGNGMGEALHLLATLCAVCIISALFNALSSHFSGGWADKVLGFCSSCAIFAAIIDLFFRQIEAVNGFFSRLSTLMAAAIPVTCTVWALGGEVTTAVKGGATLYLFLSFAEQICAKSVLPVSLICMAMAVAAGVNREVNVGALGSAVKKCYIFVLTLIMTLLLALLSAQTMLTSAADSTAARAAKLVASSLIPIVGGSVAETLRTLAASAQYIKSIVGVGGIVFVLLLVLPTVVGLLLTRLSFMLSASFAEILGCERERRLIGELGGVIGCMIAAVSISSVAFVLAMNIFIKSTVAIG